MRVRLEDNTVAVKRGSKRGVLPGMMQYCGVRHRVAELDMSVLRQAASRCAYKLQEVVIYER